jgi:hypothetical protein
MADNVNITAGAGTAIRTDDVGGVQYQVIKIDVGGDGASIPLVGDATYGIPVDLKRAQGVTVNVADGGGTLSIDDGGGNISIDDGGNSIVVQGSATHATGSLSRRRRTNLSRPRSNRGARRWRLGR